MSSLFLIRQWPRCECTGQAGHQSTIWSSPGPLSRNLPRSNSTQTLLKLLVSVTRQAVASCHKLWPAVRGSLDCVCAGNPSHNCAGCSRRPSTHLCRPLSQILTAMELTALTDVITTEPKRVELGLTSPSLVYSQTHILQYLILKNSRFYIMNNLFSSTPQAIKLTRS